MEYNSRPILFMLVVCTVCLCNSYVALADDISPGINDKNLEKKSIDNSGGSDKGANIATKEDTDGTAPTQKQVPVPTVPTSTNNITSTTPACTNGTSCSTTTTEANSFFKTITQNKDMLTRTLYVLAGVTGIVVLYFVFRAWRLKRTRKARKYGIITSPASDMEMAPLGQEDDDEDDDMTVFEMSPKRQIR